MLGLLLLSGTAIGTGIAAFTAQAVRTSQVTGLAFKGNDQIAPPPGAQGQSLVHMSS